MWFTKEVFYTLEGWWQLIWVKVYNRYALELGKTRFLRWLDMSCRLEIYRFYVGESTISRIISDLNFPPLTNLKKPCYYFGKYRWFDISTFMSPDPSLHYLQQCYIGQNMCKYVFIYFSNFFLNSIGTIISSLPSLLFPLLHFISQLGD